MMLTIDRLKKLNTQRLLSYYRKQNKKYRILMNKYWCDVCNDYHLNDISKDAKTEVGKFKKHLANIKTILDTRENIN